MAYSLKNVRSYLPVLIIKEKWGKERGSVLAPVSRWSCYLYHGSCHWDLCQRHLFETYMSAESCVLCCVYSLEGRYDGPAVEQELLIWPFFLTDTHGWFGRSSWTGIRKSYWLMGCGLGNYFGPKYKPATHPQKCCGRKMKFLYPVDR